MCLVSLFAQSLQHGRSLPRLITMRAVLYGYSAFSLVGVSDGAGEEGCSYIDFSDQDVSDATQHRHKVKYVPGVL